MPGKPQVCFCIDDFSWGVASLPEGKSWGGGGRGVFSTAVCKIQASKCCVEFLPLVLKAKRSCFSQGERFAVQLLFDCAHALRKYDG